MRTDRPREADDNSAAVNMTGRIAVVTGAGSGIGRAIALGLATRGAQVALVGRRRETLEMVAHSLADKASRALCYQADLAMDDDVRELVRRLREDLGVVDVLVHSAGVISLGRLEHASIEEFDRQYRTNVRAAYLVTQGLLPMVTARRGQVVFVNSSAGLKARGSVGQYAATKAALKAIADSLRDEVNPHGVRVLSVFLGRTATPMQAGIHQMEGRTYRPEQLLQPEDVAEVVISALTLPRSAEVTDIWVRPMRPLQEPGLQPEAETGHRPGLGGPA